MLISNRNDNEPAEIIDMDAVRPSDWLSDQPEFIVDAEAVKPSDWDNEMDGEWTAPVIRTVHGIATSLGILTPCRKPKVQECQWLWYLEKTYET